jgi:hypothetical protein
MADIQPFMTDANELLADLLLRSTDGGRAVACIGQQTPNRPGKAAAEKMLVWSFKRRWRSRDRGLRKCWDPWWKENVRTADVKEVVGNPSEETSTARTSRV